ncbi:MAG: HAD-IA family hydrolase [Succinivibrio sp.]|jgi:phosphoglycolate phosphatase|nr:HAD-IA family hydrolase [Succinivibrio sp.]
MAGSFEFTQGRRDLEKTAGIEELLSKIKGFVFDIDGTLTDSISSVIGCVGLAFDTEGLPHPEDDAVRATVGMKLEDALRTLLPPERKGEYLKFTDTYRSIFMSRPEFYEFRLFPGVLETVKKLKERGYKVSFVSGRQLKGIKRVLSTTGLEPFSDGATGGDEGPSKPDPALMRIMCDRLGLEPSEVLGVGDAGMDAQMAHRAGAKALGVESGVWSGEALLRLPDPPELLLPSAADLAKWL